MNSRSSFVWCLALASGWLLKLAITLTGVHMRRRRQRATLMLLALLVFPAAAGAATIPVPPGGNLTAAYNAAAPGDVLELTTGRYGSWDTPAGTKQIAIRAGLGTRPIFRRLHVYADNLTFDGIHVDAEGTRTAPGSPFETHGRRNITFRNGSVGNNIDQMAVLVGGATSPTSLNILFDNVEFHDAVMTPAGEAGGVHMECVYSQAAGLTIQNSRFRNCSVMDLFVTRGDWWGQQPYDDVKLINNTFDTPRRTNGACCHFYSVVLNQGGNMARGEFRGNATTINGSNGRWTSSYTFNGSVESCNTPPTGLRGITVESCEPTPEPTPTPSPTPSPTATPTPEPEPTPEPYHPACEPTCDEQIAQLQGRVEVLQDKLEQIRQIVNSTN